MNNKLIKIVSVCFIIGLLASNAIVLASNTEKSYDNDTGNEYNSTGGGGSTCECIPVTELPKTGSYLYGYSDNECKIDDNGTWLDYVDGCLAIGGLCSHTK
ncbi:hypothetical protein [Marinifilum flexuosum]|uniref:hypothetical protein n=1 Tax=Marinifilum flexuosum TaxID=1117708 RepID=UPI0024954C32|nr:hypothetical protein [Marinifilum flexuosum]